MGRNSIKGNISVRSRAYRKEKEKALREKQKKQVVQEGVAVLEIDDERNDDKNQR